MRVEAISRSSMLGQQTDEGGATYPGLHGRLRLWWCWNHCDYGGVGITAIMVVLESQGAFPHVGDDTIPVTQEAFRVSYISLLT
jgi:hypothetical protein